MIERYQAKITAYLNRLADQGRAPSHQAIAGFLLLGTRQQQRVVLDWLAQRDAGLAQRTEAALPRLQAPVVVGYTTAPVAYDGFGTETLGAAGTLDGKPLRRVEMEVQHAEWQQMRYGSGLHPCFTEAQFQELWGLPWYQAEPDRSTHEQQGRA